MASSTQQNKEAKGSLLSSVTNDGKIRMIKSLWNGYRNGFSYPVNKFLYNNKPALKSPPFTENELDKFEYLQERVQDELEIMTGKYPIEIKLEKALDMYIVALESSFKMNVDWRVFSTENTRLYRGISENPSQLKKILDSNKSFLSMSTLIDVAITHAREINKNVESSETNAFIIEYTLEPGIPMIEMNKLSEDYMMIWQEEFVLPPSLKSTLISEGTYSVPPVEKTKTMKTKKKVGKKYEYIYTKEKYTEPGYTIPLFKVHISKNAPRSLTGGKRASKKDR
jgi:hypothetical protein